MNENFKEDEMEDTEVADGGITRAGRGGARRR